MKLLSSSRFFIFWILSSCAVFTVIVLLLGILGGGEITLSKVLACVLISATVGLTLEALYRSREKFTFDLRYPRTVYGVFYILYYALPFLGKLFNDQFEFGDEAYIAFIILVGAICWNLGMRIVPCHNILANRRVISAKATVALLLVLILSVGIVIYGILWRIREGVFYNQARYVELETTILDSLRGVLAVQLQLPIILLLAMLAGLQLRGLAAMPKLLFASYGVITVLVLMLSSQTRPAITAMLFLYLGYGLKSTVKWNLKIFLTVALSSVFIVIMVQGFRITQNEEFASSSNQLLYALKNIVNSTEQLVSSGENRTTMMNAVGSRASGGIDFLNLVVREIDLRGQPFWGEGILLSLAGLVPRLFWPEKPVVVPMQIVMQQLLGFSDLYDAVPGPLIQFYFEGGLFGVVVGCVVLGSCLGWMTKRTFETGAIGWWICLAFVWSTVANAEQELVLGFFGAIRGAALMYFIWALLNIFSQKARRV